jgi:hypothetical protein
MIDKILDQITPDTLRIYATREFTKTSFLNLSGIFLLSVVALILG